MNELERVARAADELRRAGTAYLLATVVRVEGSSYRRPGARMLVADGRWIAGSVSGGCLEGDLLLRGEHRARGADAVVVTYDSTSDDAVRWGFGLGCNGVVEVLLERVAAGADHPGLAYARRCFEAAGAGELVTVFRSELAALPVGATLTRDAPAPGAAAALLAAVTGPGVVTAGGVTALVERVAPSRRLFVVGGGHDVAPVVTLARTAGFYVVVVDGRGRGPERLGGPDEVIALEGEALRARIDAAHEASVVVMSHGFERDRAALATALDSRAQYIGVLGPAERTRRLLGGGADAATLARLHAPVGLDLGAETPEEIALAIVAEVQAASRRATAAPLRDRGSRAIHATAACAVLAAGASRRLGRPKQLVAHGATTLLGHVTTACVRAAVGPVGVVLGAHAAEVAPALDGLGASTIANEGWAEGVASSVRAAVRWAEGAGAAALVVVPGDLGRLTAEHVGALAGAWRAGAPAAGSRYAGTVGAPAVFDRALWPALLALTGDRGAGALLRATPGAVAIDWPDGACDVDTEEDVRGLGGGAPPPTARSACPARRRGWGEC